MTTTPNINISDAIEQNNVKIVKLLLKNGTNLNIQDRYGYSPLHLAVNFNNLEIVNLLLEHGADPNIQLCDIWIPLHHAFFANQHDIMMILIDYGADCYLINKYGKTVLNYEGGNFIREYLISKEQQIILK